MRQMSQSKLQATIILKLNVLDFEIVSTNNPQKVSTNNPQKEVNCFLSKHIHVFISTCIYF